jgi:hypothetical protein
MHLLNLAIFLASAFAASTSPRPTTHLYVCTDASFTGTCNNLALEVSTCRNSPLLTPLPMFETLTCDVSR